MPLFGELFKCEPLPKDGVVELSEKPGWGVELNGWSGVDPALRKKLATDFHGLITDYGQV